MLSRKRTRSSQSKPKYDIILYVIYTLIATIFVFWVKHTNKNHW